MLARVPVLAAVGALVLGSLPVTEHVTRCATSAPCPAVHTVAVLPERVASGVLLALIAYAAVRSLVAVARASSRAALPGQAKARAVSALALGLLVAPASVTVAALVSTVWGFAPRTTGWAQLPVGLVSGFSVAAVLLGCAVATLLGALQASGRPEAA